MKRFPFGRLASSPVAVRRAFPLFPALVVGAVFLLTAGVVAEPTYIFVDLQPKANQALTEGPGAEENHLGTLPRGEQSMAETRFKIGEKMIHLRGEHMPDLPVKVDGIPIDAPFDRLHILHSTCYGEGEMQQTDGTEIGAYVVHYADNTTVKIPVVYGEHLRDWYDWPIREDQSVKKAKVAWTGTNPQSESVDRHIRLFAVVWENPHSDKKVTTIDFESKATLCDPFLLALTLEKKG